MSTSTATETETRHKFYWLPNALTIGRILVIPILMAGILALGADYDHAVAQGALAQSLGQGWLVGGLFVGAAFTDYLDGYLARKWKVISGFGRMIDPIADKLLVAGCLMSFMILMLGDWRLMVPAVTIIFRDILVSGAREHAALTGRIMPPTKLAKWKTAFEMAAIAALIFWIIGWGQGGSGVVSEMGFADPLKALGLIFLWVAALLSAYTGSLYLRAAISD